MTDYRDFFNKNHPTEPSALLSQTSTASFQQLGGERNNNHDSAAFTPSMFDDWLVDELCKSGIMPAIKTTPASPSPFSVDYISSERNSLPPVSPPNSVVSSEGKSNTGPTISLFPDIHENQAITHSKTLNDPSAGILANIPSTTTTTTITTTTITTSNSPTTAIKTAATPSPHHLPRLAPRPSIDNGDPVVRAPVTFSLSPTQQQKRQTGNNSNAAAVEMALKRQKNTDAARRSRLKKLLKMEQLEKRVAELETENQGLTTRIAVLESEKKGLSSKDVSHEERIRVLEAQLTEAYKALRNL